MRYSDKTRKSFLRRYTISFRLFRSSIPLVLLICIVCTRYPFNIKMLCDTFETLVFFFFLQDNTKDYIIVKIDTAFSLRISNFRKIWKIKLSKTKHKIQ